MDSPIWARDAPPRACDLAGLTSIPTGTRRLQRPIAPWIDRQMMKNWHASCLPFGGNPPGVRVSRRGQRSRRFKGKKSGVFSINTMRDFLVVVGGTAVSMAFAKCAALTRRCRLRRDGKPLGHPAGWAGYVRSIDRSLAVASTCSPSTSTAGTARPPRPQAFLV